MGDRPPRASDLSSATTRKAVFALRQCLAAAIADNRLTANAASAVPLSSERQKPTRFLSQAEVERLGEATPKQDHAIKTLHPGRAIGHAQTRGAFDRLRRESRQCSKTKPRLRSTGSTAFWDREHPGWQFMINVSIGDSSKQS